MPEYPGGTREMTKFIQTNIIYPPMAMESHVQGKVFLKFIVDTTGKITDPVVIKGSGDQSLDQEAIAVVKKMPLWIPGRQAGRAVPVLYNLPISFKSLGTVQTRAKPDQSGDEIKLSEKEKKAAHYFKLGMDQERQERYQYALDKFDLCLKYDSTHNRAWFHKGLMHYKLNDKSKACATWKSIRSPEGQDEELQKIIVANCKE